ncbi:diguanylate cyclase [Neiella sp. HB171785]|uniref:diguanylate cyclase n=1 Tax=Neiella litorisoli TaxID=2771431 RepID=A0A8J6QP84_9GAMM|nr:GGDEF domain-containing protein [Neiella litorisoli]MBD1388446.1 diguanylate cyclase [Neiella litorisoli]
MWFYCFAAAAEVSVPLEQAINELEAERWKSRHMQQQKLDDILRYQSQLTLQQQTRINIIQAQLALLDGNYGTAEQLASAIAQRTEFPNSQLAAYSLLMNLANLRGQYETAFYYMYRGEALLTPESDPRRRYEIYSSSANLLINAQIYDQAESRLASAQGLAKEIADPKLSCSAQYVQAKLAYLRQQYESAGRLLQAQIEQCRAINESLFVGAGLVWYGRTQAYEEQHEAAQKTLFEALNSLQQNGFKAGIVKANLSLAELYLRTNQFDLALQYAKESIAMGAKLEQWQDLVGAYQVAALAAERLGDLDDALYYERLLQQASEQSLVQSKAIRLAYLKARFSSTAEQQKITLFKTENELASLRKEAALTHRWLIVLGLFATCCVCALLFVMLIRSRKEHRHYRQLSQTDSLTNIFNRRYSLELAEKRYRACLVEQTPFTVVMIDVDHFKSVNDTFGHAIGDQVLKHVANQLSLAIRKRDIVGRTGGEEFALFLPSSDEAQTKAVVERCRANLATIRDKMSQQIEVTASFGIASATGGKLPLEALIRRADEALYDAKSAGRNRLVVYRSGKDVDSQPSQYEVML